MAYKMSDQVPFGIRFNITDYVINEWMAYQESIHSSLPEDLAQRYHVFIDRLIFQKSVKPSTLVDVDVLLAFGGDLDNRAQIDYREGHDHDPAIVLGGKRAEHSLGRLKAHLEKLGIPPDWY